MNQGTPKMTIRIAPRERNELARLAAENGLDLASAMRQGARFYLAALTAARSSVQKEAQAA